MNWRSMAALCLAVFCTYANGEELIDHKVIHQQVDFNGKTAIRVVEPDGKSTRDEDRLLILGDKQFKNGTIKGWIAGSPKANAGAGARGFVGIAFHINEDISAFEAVYLRPTNGRAADQLRRNHTIQYFAYPEFPWHKLRKKHPGKYETWADIGSNEWIPFRLVVKDNTLALYLNNGTTANFVVNDLKYGGSEGRVGFWIGPGTMAHFATIEVDQN